MKYTADSDMIYFTREIKAWVRGLVNGKKIKASNIDSESAPAGKILTTTGSGGASWVDQLTAGNGISIVNGVISVSYDLANGQQF